MPKLKTRKSLTKRFRLTKNGKVMRRQGFASHLNAGKTKKKMRRLTKTIEMTGYYAKKIKKALGK